MTDKDKKVIKLSKTTKTVNKINFVKKHKISTKDKKIVIIPTKSIKKSLVVTKPINNENLVLTKSIDTISIDNNNLVITKSIDTISINNDKNAVINDKNANDKNAVINEKKPNEYKINYIIATWNGIKWIKSDDKQNNRRRVEEQNRHKQEDVLKIHLKYLSNLEHNLTNITVVTPENNDKKNILTKYYDVLNNQDIKNKIKTPINIRTCKNHGFSYGQWLLELTDHVNDYDYHILVEDDTVGGFNHFDTKMIELYQKMFPTNIGYLCGFASSFKDIPHHAAISYGIISKQSIQKLLNYWNNKPYKQLGKIHQDTLNKNGSHKRSTIEDGGKCQIEFSLILQQAGINITDWRDYYFTAYWEGSKSKCDIFVNYSRVKHTQQLIMPTQMIDSPSIKYDDLARKFIV